jgi:universal stress protein E
MANNQILVIIDPTTNTQPAFERALDTARDTGAALHLYACVDRSCGYADEDDMRQQLQPRLEELTARATKAGQQVVSELEWAPHWAARAVSAAARISATMIFKDSVDHSAVVRELRATSDWTLLRTSPCPVLMVKNFHDWKGRRILAAINPASTESAHIKLDHQIISLARQFAASYGSEAHFVSVFQDLNHTPDQERIASDCGVQPEHIHLRQGKVADIVRDVAVELDVDLIIVGTVARDGIKGRVIGNTCERLLDQTHTDVLVLS